MNIRGFAGEATSSSDLKVKELPQAKEGETPEFFRFTFACPHKELYQDAPVRTVAIPGSDGRFAVSPGHIPVVCEMQPGIVSVYHERTEASGKQDHWFVAGGFCVVHSNASCEIAATEAVLLNDIDLNEGLTKAQQKMSQATNDKEKYEAEIEYETYDIIEKSLGSVAH
ncbi:F-type H-ATPase delta subunit [Reticulomyxa filosa]|uniref:F-type H-ATPase delta subunit n=1 Tax=Reticulomyxa filosa TaxID=46433 RepID=X6PCZ0_RETFI|nr:F-type H-ATPase delta subunit [Reticulomyxa filosa]|eukprot:ETO35542.1 F-type H-ATPase delta subunit [Reticulomyxa filosa]